MAGGQHRKAERNRRIYEAWKASQDAARLLGDRAKTLSAIARMFASPGERPLSRARICVIIQAERRRQASPQPVIVGEAKE